MALTSQGVGTYWYLPPETFAPCNPVISNKVDIWSLGIIFYEMLFAKRPFGQSITQTSYFNADTLNPLELFGESVRIS
jgi:tousled-like kinase